MGSTFSATEFSREEICRMFEVPQEIVMAGEMTVNIEMQEKALREMAAEWANDFMVKTQFRNLSEIVGAPHVLGLSTQELGALYCLLNNVLVRERLSAGRETLSVISYGLLRGIASAIEGSVDADILNSWLTTPTTLATDTRGEQKSSTGSVHSD